MNKQVVLSILAGLVALAAGAALVWVVQRNTLTAKQLCQGFAVLIVRSDSELGHKGTSSYDYFKEHPKALRAAHRETRRYLLDLPCSVPKKK